MPPHHISRYSDKVLENIAQIFQLDLLEIYHEPLQEIHSDYYKATIWAQKFLKTPLIDRGIARKFINKCGILGRKFIKIPSTSRGHTVIAVYKVR